MQLPQAVYLNKREEKTMTKTMQKKSDFIVDFVIKHADILMNEQKTMDFDYWAKQIIQYMKGNRGSDMHDATLAYMTKLDIDIVNRYINR